MKIKEVYQRYLDALQPLYGELEAHACASLLVEELYGFKRPYDQTQEVICDTDEVVADLLSNKPVQQIIGHAHFYDLKFRVTPDVLIPRGETEELVDWILKDCKGRQNVRVLDIGTGSGAIAIALDLNLVDGDVTGVDVSPQALEVAKENGERLNARVCFSRKDILCEDLSEQYDVIVSNPPYVTKREMALMRRNVLDYEPSLALFVEDDDPLLFYRRIAQLAMGHLTEGGVLYFEINESYGAECCDLLKSMGYGAIVLRKDLNSRDRMVRASVKE